MHKKLLVVVMTVLAVMGLYAQTTGNVTVEFSGEMKTGVWWRRWDVTGEEPDEIAEIKNDDGDSGPSEGRARLNLHIKKDIIGAKVRFEQTAWKTTSPNVWSFVFAYGDFFNNQLRVATGKLGESPWAAGGPDIYKELDDKIGVRFEVKPAIVPGLNVGFVLNTWDEATYSTEKMTLVDILQETVLGVSYTHDYFHVRFCWRLDGEADVITLQDGMQMMYRVEERILGKMVPGLQLWANGHWMGIGTEDQDPDYAVRSYVNWFYAQYAPENFTAQLRLGYAKEVSYDELRMKASFYYNILSWLSAGVAVNFSMRFGDDKPVKDVPFHLINVEPQVKMTFAPGTYVALVYLYEYEYLSSVRSKQTNKINLRTVFTF